MSPQVSGLLRTSLIMLAASVFAAGLVGVIMLLVPDSFAGPAAMTLSIVGVAMMGGIVAIAHLLGATQAARTNVAPQLPGAENDLLTRLWKRLNRVFQFTIVAILLIAVAWLVLGDVDFVSLLIRVVVASQVPAMIWVVVTIVRGRTQRTDPPADQNRSPF